VDNFDLILVQPHDAVLESTLENYLKTAATLTYPENYLKVFAELERQVEIYIRLNPAMQAEAARYVKTIGLLQRDVDVYMKLAVAFPAPSQRYIKTAATMQARGDNYLRLFAQFVMHADYIKVRAALSKQPVIGDVGDDPPPNKVGLLSRHYLSVTSVKKEV
jgi:hypothetical protein